MNSAVAISATSDLDLNRTLVAGTVDCGHVGDRLRTIGWLHRLGSESDTHPRTFRGPHGDGVVIDLSCRNILGGRWRPGIALSALDAGRQPGIFVVDRIFHSRLSGPFDHPRDSSIDVAPACLDILHTGVLVVNTVAVRITNTIAIRIPEGVVGHLPIQGDGVSVLADSRVLDAGVSPPSSRNVALTHRRSGDRGDLARECGVLDRAVADLLARIEQERKFGRPLEKVGGVNRELLTNFKLVGRPRAVHGDGGSRLGRSGRNFDDLSSHLMSRAVREGRCNHTSDNSSHDPQGRKDALHLGSFRVCESL